MFLDFLFFYEIFFLILGLLMYYVNGEEVCWYLVWVDIEWFLRSLKVFVVVFLIYFDLWCLDFDVGEICGWLLFFWEVIVSFVVSRIVFEFFICICCRMWLYYCCELGDVCFSGICSNGRIKVYCFWKVMVCE